jgi:hypothetical protein
MTFAQWTTPSFNSASISCSAFKFELFGHGLSDVNGIHSLDVRKAFQIQNVSDQFIRVLHFVDAAFAHLVIQALVAPIFAHLSVHKILVDGRQIGRKNLVEEIHDSFLCLHSGPPFTNE